MPTRCFLLLDARLPAAGAYDFSISLHFFPYVMFLNKSVLILMQLFQNLYGMLSDSLQGDGIVEA